MKSLKWQMNLFELANEERGIAEANVYTVRPLTDDRNVKLFPLHLQRKLAKNHLSIENIVDSNLLGGIKLRIGNRIFDGSLAASLIVLERTIIKLRFVDRGEIHEHQS